MTEHGGRGRAIARSLGMDPNDVLDLSASLNPFAPDVAGVVAGVTAEVRSYPDPADATAALAGAIGVDPGRLVLTNGGSEAIALVAAVLGSGWIEEPEFSLYRRYLPSVAPGAPRWRSDPNNPRGRLAAPDDTEGVVWDEAFHPLATGLWTAGEQRPWRLGSLTKVWGCPGLRLGYVIAPDVASAERVRERQPQWAVNGLALAVVAPLLERTDLPGWRDKITRARGELVACLEDEGFTVTDTDAPWVLVDGAADLVNRLTPEGIVVRDCTSFGMPDTVRIGVTTSAGIDRIADALGGSGEEQRLSRFSRRSGSFPAPPG